MNAPPRLLLAAGLAVVGLTAWGWWSGARNVRETRRVVEELEARRAALEQRNRALAREIEALRREEAARERAARQLLGVASPEEVIVLLPTPTPATGPPPPAARRTPASGLR